MRKKLDVKVGYYAIQTVNPEEILRILQIRRKMLMTNILFRILDRKEL